MQTLGSLSAAAPETAASLLTIDDVRAAAERIAGKVVHTPTLHSRTLSKIAGCDIWLKFENLQFTAAYKERGALNALLQLTGWRKFGLLSAFVLLQLAAMQWTQAQQGGAGAHAGAPAGVPQP